MNAGCVSLEWFSMVEVEISTACNRTCWYCPNSVPELRRSQQLMQESVFERLLSELRWIEFCGRISYHLYNEPLLHPQVCNIVACVTKELPGVRQVLYTNGDLLTNALHSKLTQLGIARFIVTSHDSQPIKERDNQIVLLPSMLNLTNRGGTVLKKQTKAVKWPLSAPCYAPSSMLIVTISGDVILCYEDAERTVQLGNIVKKSLEDIWFSKRFISIRRALSSGDRNAESVCSRCSNVSHPTLETFDYRL
jgi:2-deoxy-scyllo-inosamine dehydrogenase (SAM-dependent)